MLVSKKNLQSYFDTELPSAHTLADILMTHSFEIEGVEEVCNDWVIDIDVLPNRAHDCLSHKGIAQEISTLLNIPMRDKRYSIEDISYQKDKKVSISVENKEQCLRYSAVPVYNISIKESPEWLKNRLKSWGQKTINNLVDATNYILFDLGQPLHVFDADKVVGNIIVRNAKLGERITTLSGDDLELLESDLVIADQEGILALAGVKGGVRAEVTESTKNIIVEAANFNPITTRKTARRVKILTDASKRYENALSSELTGEALESMLALVLELAGTDDTFIGEINDYYPNKEEEYILKFSREHAARVLGFNITQEEVSDILDRLKFHFSSEGDVFSVSIPALRLDLRIPEDMIEEIGRIYGYHNIPVKSVNGFDFEPTINIQNYASQLLTNYFIQNGFFEIKNYSFVKKGDIELSNPLGKEKVALRKKLDNQMQLSLERNLKNADFLGLDQVALFEIDSVVKKDSELLVCCFGIDALSKKNRNLHGDEQAQINEHKKNIQKLLKKQDIQFTQSGFIVSFEIDASYISAEKNDFLEALDLTSYSQEAQFIPISKFQYGKRDISFWIEGLSEDDIYKELWGIDTSYLKKVYLFDCFEKEGRVSYAFSLIFQSEEKTLTDEDIEKEMKKINQRIQELGGEIR